MQANTLSGGFADPATQSANAFRSVMEAMARPGTIQDIEGAAPPAPLSPAMGAVLLTLCDTETPVYLAGDMDCEAARAWLAFHTGAPFVGPAQCMFAVGKWDALAPLAVYPIGTSEYNIALGMRRAEAAKAYLAKLGADRNMFSSRTLIRS